MRSDNSDEKIKNSMQKDESKLKKEEPPKKILILPPELRVDKSDVQTISPGFIRNKYIKVLIEREEKLKILQKKRERIFNSELSGLVNKITKSKTESPVESSKPISTETTTKPDFSNIFPQESLTDDEFISNIYASSNPRKKASIYILNIIQKYFDLKSFSFNLFFVESGVYFPLITYNLDRETSTNLIIAQDDPILSKLKDKYCFVHFNKKFIKNPFYRKKFSEISLGKYTGFLIVPVPLEHTKALLCLFSDTQIEPKSETFQLLTQELERKTKPLLPLFQKELHTEFGVKNYENDLIGKVYQYIHHYITSFGHCNIIHIKIENYFVVIGRIFLKLKVIDELKKILEETDRLVDYIHNEILFISQVDKKEEISKILDENCKNGFVYDVVSMSYFEDGKNLYFYLYLL